MFRTLVLSAAAAGLAAGIVGAALQHTMTTPIILEAEFYENGGAPAGHDAGTAASGDASAAPARKPQAAAAADEHDGAGPWVPAAGLERALFTSLSTVLLAIGYGLVLLSLMVVLGVPISGRTGLMFGAAGFAAASLAPAIGLPPELPGSASAALESRQAWWVLAVASTAAGIAALLIGRMRWLRVAGLVLIGLPHVAGAPRPEVFESPVPGELTGHFVAASLALAAVMWALVGFLSGAIHERLARPA